MDLEPKKIGRRFGHDRRKLCEADHPISVAVRLFEHLGKLLEGERVAHLRHGLGKLRRGYISIAISVEGSEHLHELLLIHQSLRGHLGQDGVNQLIEFDRPITIGVHVCQHQMHLITCGLEAQGAEERGELKMGEAAIRIHIKPCKNVSQMLEMVCLHLSHCYNEEDKKKIGMRRERDSDQTRKGKERRGRVGRRLFVWCLLFVRDVGWLVSNERMNTLG